jgi:hypothetical protein
MQQLNRRGDGYGFEPVPYPPLIPAADTPTHARTQIALPVTMATPMQEDHDRSNQPR